MRLRRSLLDSVGHPDARFEPLLLDFRGDNGGAQDTVLWLRNGGGKTSLLSLMFSVVQPARNLFLGYLQKGKLKSIDKYLLSGDVGHVILEWEGEGLPGMGRPFITGVCMAIRSGAGGEENLDRYFYGFSAIEGRFGLDDLPIREGNRRTTYRRYRQLLEEIAGDHPATDMVIRDAQADWLEYLERSGLDPESFRYQLNMNRDEGGAGEILKRFSDADTFIDFLVDVVSNPADVEAVLGNLEQVIDKIEMRPRREREREFVAGAIERLRPLSDAHSTWQRLREEHAQVLLAGSRLRRRLSLSAQAAHAEHEQQKEEAARQRTIFQNAERARSHYDRQANALQVEVLTSRIAELADTAQTARDMEAEARRLVRAWDATDRIVELNEVEARATALKRALEQEISDAADLHCEYQLAAMRLRLHYVGLAATAREIAGQADKMAELSKAARLEADGQEQGAIRRLGEIETELRQLNHQLSSLRARLEALVKDGMMAAGLSAAAAAATAREQDSATEKRLQQLPAEKERLEDARTQALNQALAAGERLGDVTRDHEQLTARREGLLGRARQLTESERLRELTHHEPIDIFVASHSVIERLVDAMADADRQLVEVQVEALEDRRALQGIEEGGLLPAAVGVERAVAFLEEAKIGAITGWQYLAQNVNRSEWPRLLETRPEVTDAVVVQPGCLEQAASVLAATDPTMLVSNLVVVESMEFEQPDVFERRLWVLPPSPARYDADATDAERTLREARVGQADEKVNALATLRAQDYEILGQLRDLLRDCPPGYLESIDNDLREQEKEISQLGSRKRELEEGARRAAADLKELSIDERRLGDLRARLGRAITRLEEAARQEVESAEWMERQARLGEEKTERLGEQEQAKTAKQEAYEREERWRRDASQARNDVRNWSTELERLSHYEVQVEAPEGVTLEVLRAEFETLKNQYERRTTKSQVARDHDAESRRAGQIRGQLRPYADVEDLARTQLASEGSESAGYRAERLDQARLDLEEATTIRLRAEQEHENAKGELKRLSGATKDLTTLSEDLRPKDKADAERLLGEVNLKMVEERTRRDFAETAQRDSADKAKEASHRYELLTSEERHLGQALEEQAVESYVTYEPLTAEEAKQEVERIVDRLRQAQHSVQEQDAWISRTATILRQFAGRSDYEELEGPHRERLMDPDDKALGRRAEGDLIEYERRLPFLDHQLAEIEKHQSRVTDQILVLVDDAVQNLRWLQRQQMPGGLGAWSTEHYFTISFDLPNTQEERRLRIQLLLDEIVVSKQRVRDVKLVQRALHRINRRQHFEVRVIKPNEGLRVERVSVSEIGAWSGGQKLTTAVLIYCALARLRADNRAKQGTSPVGVLMLDNPIGTANLTTLIDLQRLVAEKFGVQLIYTTALDDKPALAPFTNIIRLGNRHERRQDRHHIVHEALDEEVVNIVDAARIYRRRSVTAS